MLLLKVNCNVNWEWIYSKLLIGLVEKSGTWSNEVIKKIGKQGIIVYRNKHTRKISIEKEQHIYLKIRKSC